MELSSRTWLLTRGGKVFGYLERVPVDDWEDFEAPARAYFGDPGRNHFAAAEPGGRDSRFFHVYQWQDGRTRCNIVKVTAKDTSKRWTEARTGTQIRLRVMQLAEDQTVPLYFAAFSLGELRRLGLRAPPAPRPRFLGPAPPD